MKKLKLIVSDFHIGAGRLLPDGSFNYLDDFRYDDKFIEFLNYHRSGDFAEAEIELICNGDFFNHLQVDPNERTPDVIDEGVAVERTEKILKGHPGLFESMRAFAAAPRHSITFVLGNHDPGLLFPAVHNTLRRVLGNNIEVKTGKYFFDGVHVEHGNQYYADNAYDPKRYFLSKGLERPIVNLPWGSFFVIHFLNKSKKERPYFDKIYPFKYYLRWALFQDTTFALRTIARIVFYFVWIRFRRDPHRRSPILKTLKIILEVPVGPRLDRYAKKILLSKKDVKIVVFGHTHHAVVRQFATDKVYINTGLWNEQVSLDISDPGKIVRLTYARLEYDDRGTITPTLKEWKGAYRNIEDLS